MKQVYIINIYYFVLNKECKIKQRSYSKGKCSFHSIANLKGGQSSEKNTLNKFSF